MFGACMELAEDLSAAIDLGEAALARLVHRVDQSGEVQRWGFPCTTAWHPSHPSRLNRLNRRTARQATTSATTARPTPKARRRPLTRSAAGATVMPPQPAGWVFTSWYMAWSCHRPPMLRYAGARPKRTNPLPSSTRCDLTL
jgi:hypothetical protein